MLTVAWENTMQYFPEFYIMRLLGLHPKALPDSKLQQGVYCRLPDCRDNVQTASNDTEPFPESLEGNPVFMKLRFQQLHETL